MDTVPPTFRNPEAALTMAELDIREGLGRVYAKFVEENTCPAIYRYSKSILLR